jgi:hypothetical protein
MPTQDYTELFASDTGIFIEQLVHAAIDFAFNGGTGSPSAGCAEFTCTTDNQTGITEIAANTVGVMWETLFPAAAGKLCKQIQLPTIRLDILTDVESSGTLEVYVADGSQSGFLSILDGNLLTVSIGAGVATGWATNTSGALRNVNSTHWLSTSLVRLVVKLTLTTGDGIGGGG